MPRFKPKTTVYCYQLRVQCGLLNWTLNAVSAPLNGSKVINQQEDQHLQALLAHAANVAKDETAQIGLAIGGYLEGCLSLALHTPEKSYAQRVRYMPSQHNTSVKQ